MGIQKQLRKAVKAASGLFSISSPTAITMMPGGGGISIASAYDKSAVAYSCIKRVSQDISGSPLIFLRDPYDTTSIVPDTNPTVKLFKSPAPYLTTEQFLQYITTWLQLRGEYFVIYDDPQNPTVMIPVADPLSFRTLSGPEGLAGFELTSRGRPRVFTPDELTHHRYINPANPYRGLSPLSAAAYALNIDVSGDQLGADIMDRGGETGLVYEIEDELMPEQHDELESKLKSRRDSKGRIPKDMLLTGGLTITDPKFTAFDYAVFDRMPPAMQKITMVYGLSPSLIGHDDEPNYATFEGRLKIYWQQTVLPIITGMEKAFDPIFASGSDPVYVRWDRTQIKGLQADQRAQADTAGVLKRAGLPWAVINSHLKMGLPVEEIPGAEEVMVPSTNAPLSQLIADWEYKPPAAPAAKESGSSQRPRSKSLTNSEIRKRSTDPLAIRQRDRQLGSLERAVGRSWRSLNYEYRKRILKEWDKAVKENPSVDVAYQAFTTAIEPILVDEMGDQAVDDIQPRQIQSGEIGESSIETLATREAQFDTMNTKAGRLSPKTLLQIKGRENFIVELTDDGLFQPIVDSVYKTINELGELGEVKTEIQKSLDAQKAIKHDFNNSANRATTIARTEVGTAYNIGRFNEMGEQGFEKHEWIANAGDDDTRETHEMENGTVVKVNDRFPTTGLLYPQEPGGEPGEVINCRCLTLPVVEE